MTRRPKLMFTVLFIIHAVLSWFAIGYCEGVSMALLDSGHAEAPPMLNAVCVAAVAFRLPLLPLENVIQSALNFSSPTIPASWVLIPPNSLLAVAILYLLVYGFKRLMRHQQTSSHQKT
jgi:hypothetical protein